MTKETPAFLRQILEDDKIGIIDKLLGDDPVEDNSDLLQEQLDAIKKATRKRKRRKNQRRPDSQR